MTLGIYTRLQTPKLHKQLIIKYEIETHYLNLVIDLSVINESLGQNCLTTGLSMVITPSY